MKLIKDGNIVIAKEMTDNRFYDLVTGHRVDKDGVPVAFLGKYKIPSNFTEEEIIDLYRKEGK